MPVGCRPDANPNPNHGLREGVVFLRARGRALDECSPFFVTLHFHSQAAKAGIAIAASAQTVKLWLLQEGAFVLHLVVDHESRPLLALTASNNKAIKAAPPLSGRAGAAASRRDAISRCTAVR